MAALEPNKLTPPPALHWEYYITCQPDGYAHFSQFVEAAEDVLSQCNVYHSPLYYRAIKTGLGMMMSMLMEVPAPLHDSNSVTSVEVSTSS